MNNKQIAGTLHALADYMEIKGENVFKVNAFRRAARTIENSRFQIAEALDRLPELPGIGKGTAEVIREIVATGTSRYLEELKAELPPELPLLLKLPGLGQIHPYVVSQTFGHQFGPAETSGREKTNPNPCGIRTQKRKKDPGSHRTISKAARAFSAA